MDFIVIHINSFRFLIYNNDFLLNSNSGNPPFLLGSIIHKYNDKEKKTH